MRLCVTAQGSHPSGSLVPNPAVKRGRPDAWDSSNRQSSTAGWERNSCGPLPRMGRLLCGQQHCFMHCVNDAGGSVGVLPNQRPDGDKSAIQTTYIAFSPQNMSSCLTRAGGVLGLGALCHTQSLCQSAVASMLPHPELMCFIAHFRRPSCTTTAVQLLRNTTMQTTACIMPHTMMRAQN